MVRRLRLGDILKQDLNEAGFEKPTAIQMQVGRWAMRFAAEVWPAAKSGHDLIGLAPCGTGKTLAYLVPILEHCKAQSGELQNGRGPMALILVSNGDLAKQIRKQFQALRRPAALAGVSYWISDSICYVSASSRACSVGPSPPTRWSSWCLVNRNATTMGRTFWWPLPEGYCRTSWITRTRMGGPRFLK